MGNHKMEHCQSRINIAPPIVSETTIVETQKQHVRVGITQSIGTCIISIGVEMVVVPNIDVVRRVILIRSATKLGSRLNGVSTLRNLSRSLTLPTTIIGVVGMLQMVFTNPIMTTHVSKIRDQPLMNSMAARRYKSADAMHPRGGYQKPIVITAPIFDHKDDHYVKPNMVVLQYPNFEKNVDPNAHVKLFSFVVKINVKISEEYIVNTFSYMVRDTASKWCRNYMSKFPNYSFSELTQAFCKCHW